MRIVRAVQPNDAQKEGARWVRAASAKAAEKIAATCGGGNSHIGQRAAVFHGEADGGHAGSRSNGQAAFDAFYATLDDKQRPLSTTSIRVAAGAAGADCTTIINDPERRTTMSVNVGRSTASCASSSVLRSLPMRSRWLPADRLELGGLDRCRAAESPLRSAIVRCIRSRNVDLPDEAEVLRICRPAFPVIVRFALSQRIT